MAGGAAGGFITRAFESMLKEASGKKYTTLQTAIQSYLGFFFLHHSLFHFIYLESNFSYNVSIIRYNYLNYVLF